MTAMDTANPTEPLKQLASWLAESGPADAAEVALARLEASGEGTYAAGLRARRLAQSGDLNGAIAVWQTVLAAAPTDPEALAGVATARKLLGSPLRRAFARPGRMAATGVGMVGVLALAAVLWLAMPRGATDITVLADQVHESRRLQEQQNAAISALIDERVATVSRTVEGRLTETDGHSRDAVKVLHADLGDLSRQVTEARNQQETSLSALAGQMADERRRQESETADLAQRFETVIAGLGARADEAERQRDAMARRLDETARRQQASDAAREAALAELARRVEVGFATMDRRVGGLRRATTGAIADLRENVGARLTAQDRRIATLPAPGAR